MGFCVPARREVLSYAKCVVDYCIRCWEEVEAWKPHWHDRGPHGFAVLPRQARLK